MYNPSTTTIVPQDWSTDNNWLTFFSVRAAIAAVAAHIEALPSSRTEERHTWKVYQAGLLYFLDWLGQRLPTEDLLTAFVGHLVRDRQLKSTTIGSKYLAPVRLYLTKLAGQHINVSGAERDYVADCRDHIRAAASVKTPRPETTSNIAPLWRPEFHRLNVNQVNAVLRSVDRSTISGKRDYALLHAAFSTGLRLAELHRITPASISRLDDAYVITVRGKRSNSDPVPLPAECYRQIVEYVEAYNAPLPDGDPRRIAPGSPLWQPLVHGDHHPHVGVNRYDPARGLSQQGIRNLIKRRTEDALGSDFALAAHDTRRTAAAIAYDAGMPLNDISSLLRHKDAAVTLRYVGTKPDFHARSLATYVNFG